ncbi:MAG TPA: HWE histidine kinase domain-containing protein [Xanthobacteraceae bacterium]|nr:HWE histidine kinase domain-containing protein [Xanthobacteraceae bacterium]
MVMPEKKTPERNGLTAGVVRGAAREPARDFAQDSASEFFPNAAIVRAGLESAHIGVWSWDAETNTLTWSINLESLHGLSPRSFNGTLAGFLDCIHGEDRANVEALLKEAMHAQSPFRARYRTPQRDGRDECWLEATGSVIAEGGKAKGISGLCYDITGRVSLENELRTRAKQQEALAQIGEHALAEPDLDRLLNDAVSTVALTLSVDFVTVLELLPGGRELLLRAGFGWKSDFVGTVLTTAEPDSLARLTLDTTGPVMVEDFSTEKRFVVPSYLKDHNCVSGMNVTIAGRDGRAYGVLGVCASRKRHFTAQDAIFLAAAANLLAGAVQSRLLEQRHELMIRDMRHRSGNLFSQLLALFSQTARTSKNIPDLTGKYQARVLAMANAHRLITEGGWQSIPLSELLNAVLGPYLERTSLKGPDIDLEPDPVFSLNAALHELAANATKHGSLSRSKGQLDLHWTVERTARGMTLIMDWVEKNGPPARRPRKSGFGTRLIDLVIQRQLNGEVIRTYSSNGLSVKLLVPLTHERWPAQEPVGDDGADKRSGKAAATMPLPREA